MLFFLSLWFLSILLTVGFAGAVIYLLYKIAKRIKDSK